MSFVRFFLAKNVAKKEEVIMELVSSTTKVLIKNRNAKNGTQKSALPLSLGWNTVG